MVLPSQPREAGSDAAMHPFHGAWTIRHARLKLLLTTLNPLRPWALAYSLAAWTRSNVQFDPPKARILPARWCSFKTSTNSPTGTSRLSRCKR